MHFNTRYIYTSYGWFGGGIDLRLAKDDKVKKSGFIVCLKKHVICIIKITTLKYKKVV